MTPQETPLVNIDGRKYPEFKGNVMIADSGCSYHLVKNRDCLEEVETISKAISGIGEG